MKTQDPHRRSIPPSASTLQIEIDHLNQQISSLQQALAASETALGKAVLANAQAEARIHRLQAELREQNDLTHAAHQVEARYRSLAELGHVFGGILRVDERGGLESEWISEEFLSRTGYELQDLEPGDAWMRLFHPRDLPAAAGVLDTVLSGQSDDGELRILTKAGEERWLHYYACPDHGQEHDRVTRIFYAIQDITERKAAETATLQRQTRLNLLRSIAAGITLGMPAQEIVIQAVDRIQQVFPGMRVSFSQIEASGRLRVLHSAQPVDRPASVGLELDLNRLPIALDAFRERRAIAFSNLEQEPALAEMQTFFAQIGVSAALIVPLVHSRGLAGLIGLDQPQPYIWITHEIAAIEDVADYLAVVIAAAEAEAETVRRAEEAEALYAITRDLAVQHDLPALLDATVARAMQLLGCTSGAIYLYDAQRQDLELVVAKGFEPPGAIRLQLGEGAAGEVAATGEPILILDYSSWPGRSPQYQGVPSGAVLQVPMFYQGELIGVLGVQEDGGSERVQDPASTRLLSLFAAQTAAAVHNTRLYQAMQQELEERRRAEQAERQQRTLAEALADTAAILNSTLDLDQVLDQILVNVDLVLPHISANIMLIADGVARVVRRRGYKATRLTGAESSPLPVESVRGLQHMIAAGEPLVIPDTSEFEGWFAAPESAWIRSYVGAPIRSRGETIGFLSLDAAVPGFFDQTHAIRLRAFADQAASAVFNARLYQAMQQELEERRRAEQAERVQRTLAEALRKTTAALNSALEPDEVLDQIIAHLELVLPFDAAGIMVLEGGFVRSLRLRDAEGSRRRQRFLENPVPLHELRNYEIILETGQALVVSDTQQAPHWRTFPETAWIRSLVSAPIHLDRGIYGFLDVASATPDFYQQEHAARLQALADQAAVTLAKAHLLQETRRRADEFEALYQTTRQIAEQHDLQPLLETLLARVLAYLGASGGTIVLYDASSDLLQPGVSSRPGPSPVPSIRMGEGLVGSVAQTLTPLVVDDYAQWQGRLALPSDFAIAAAAAVPMVFAGALIGVLLLYETSPSTRRFTAADERFLTVIASHAAGAIHNARLYQAMQRELEERKRAEQAEREQRTLAEALRDTAAALNSTLDLNQVLDQILRSVSKVAPHDAANIMLIEGDRVRVVRGRSSRPDLGEGLDVFSYRLDELQSLSTIIETGQPVVISNTTRSERWQKVPGRLWVNSYVGVPIRIGGQVAGFLNLDSATPDFYTAAHAEHLRIFADDAATAMHNARLFAETQRRAEELATLSEITSDLATYRELEPLLQTIVERGLALLKASMGGIYLYDASEDELELTVSTGPYFAPGTRLRLGESTSGMVALTREPLIVDDYSSWPHRSTQYITAPISAVLAVPMQYGGELIGVLVVNEVAGSLRTFSQADARLLSLLASQAAGAVVNARLFAQERRRLEAAVALQRVTQAISASLQVDELLRALVEAVARHTRLGMIAVLVWEPEGKRLHTLHGYAPELQGFLLPHDQGVVRRFAHDDTPILVPDVWRDPDYTVFIPHARSLAIAPIHVASELWGMLCAESTGVLDQSDLDWLSAISRQLGVVLENARLYHELQEAFKNEQAMRAQLIQSEKLAVVGRMVATITHELNNPLQSIQNCLFLIQHELAGDSPAGQFIDIAGSEVQRLAGLIAQLRSVYRPRVFNRRLESVDLAAILESVRLLLEPQLQRYQISWRRRGPKHLIVTAVADELKQVFLNLCLNAIDAMQAEGGLLEVILARSEDERQVSIAIRDTGHGIPPDQLRRLFEPFVTTKAQGLGLGLAICQDIIARYEGCIDVASTYGQGAEFTVSLPATLESPAPG